jgi:hypothetical protein
MVDSLFRALVNTSATVVVVLPAVIIVVAVIIAVIIIIIVVVIVVVIVVIVVIVCTGHTERSVSRRVSGTKSTATPGVSPESDDPSSEVTTPASAGMYRTSDDNSAF